MLRRILYSLVLVVSLPVLWTNGRIYVHDVQLGLAMRSAGLLQLTYVLACVAIPFIALRTLMRLHRRSEDRDSTAPSFRKVILRIQAVWSIAFAARPVSAYLLSLLLIAIPFGLVLMASGGWGSFGPYDWVMLGIAELPIAVVILVGLVGRRSNRKAAAR